MTAISQQTYYIIFSSATSHTLISQRKKRKKIIYDFDDKMINTRMATLLNLSMTSTYFFLVVCIILIIITIVNGSDVSHPKLDHLNVRDLQKDGYDIVPDEYIIEFHDNTTVNATSVVEQLLTATDARIDHVFEHAMNGVIISGISNEHLTSLLDHPLIKSAERNLISPGERKLATRVVQTQSNVGWNLDRLYSPYGDGKFNYSYDGTGVVVYVLGSGLRLTHEEFGGRASCAFTVTNTSCADDFGSGTAYASVIGGTTVGVAKNVTLKAVKVRNNKGVYFTSYALKAAEFLLKEKENNPTTPMIISTSIYYPGIRRRSTRNVINKLLKAGFVIVAAAGDSRESACNYVPQGIKGCITVSGTNRNNTRVPYINYGHCVDILAPAYDVIVATNVNDTGKEIYDLSGNAAGHVAGVAAMYLQKNPTWNATQVADALRQDAIKDAIKLPNNKRRYTPNLLLNIDNITNSAFA